MAILATPFETDAPRTRFSRHDSRFVAKSAHRFRRALTYDVKGNLVTRPASLQSPALSLVWDFDNKLKGVDINGTPATLEVTYEYDALGRRVARGGPGGNVVYFQAGQQTIADYPRGGVPASATYRYVYGSYIDEPLLRETVSGSVRHFFHRNQQYSVTALTDSAGNTAERYAYTAYGALTVFNSSGIPQATSPLNNRYTYTGREWDDSTKLYHFRTRWYAPAAGRFVGRDPLGFVDGIGLYGGNFVWTGVDPSGCFNISIEINAFIPKSLGFPVAIPASEAVDLKSDVSAVNWLPEPPVDLGTYFSTDDKEHPGEKGSHRLQVATINSIGAANIGRMEGGSYFKVDVGFSHRIKISGGNHVPGSLEEKRDEFPTFEEDVRDFDHQDFFGFPLKWPLKGTCITVEAGASYPFANAPLIGNVAPQITIYFTACFYDTITARDAAPIWRLKINGSHDTFPAYEVLVNGKREHEHFPSAKGPGFGLFVINFRLLYPAKDFSVDKVWLRNIFP